MTLLIVGWSLTSILCSIRSTTLPESWRSTVSCAVHGICRSIWNESFGFACCGRMLHHKNPESNDSGFLRGRDRTRTARPRRRRGKQQPSGLLFSARFPTARNVYQESTTCQSIFSASASSNNRPIAKGRVSSWRCYPAFCALWLIGEQSLRMSVHGRYARTQEKEKVPAYRGVLSAGGMIYST